MAMSTAKLKTLACSTRFIARALNDNRLIENSRIVVVIDTKKAGTLLCQP